MSVLLNGSSQYLTLGNAVSVVGARPITLAALIDTSTLRTSGAWNSIFSQGDYGDRGWGVEVEAAAGRRLYSTYTTSLGNDENFSSWAVTNNSGWWLVMVVIRDTGVASATHFYGYRYNIRAGVFGTTGGGGTSAAEPIAPGASDPTLIGAFNDAGIIDFYPGGLGWLGIWNYDFSNGGNAGSPYFHRLVNEGAWAFQNRLYKPSLFVPFSASNNLHDLSPVRRPISAAAGLTWQRSVFTEARPRIFNVEWLVPQPQAGGVVYDKTGTLTSPAALSGADSNVFTDTAQSTAPGVLTGADANIFSDTAAVTSPAVISGIDANIFSDSGAVSSPAVITGADSSVFNDASAIVTPAVISGEDSNVYNDASSVVGPAVISGADSNIFTRTGAITSPASVSGTDSNVFNETSATLTPAVLSGVATAQAVYDKTGAITCTLTLSGTDANVFSETSATTAPSVLSGQDSNVFSDTSSATSPASISGDVQVVYNELGTTTTPAVISGAVIAQVVYTKTGTLSATLQLSGADSVVYGKTGNTTATLALSGVRAASAGGGSTQWVPLGYDDVLYNQELQKAAERDKLAARLKREKRDEQDLIDILLIL